MDVTRRQFLGIAAIGAATVGMAACGGSNSNEDMQHGNVECSMVTPTIVGNHGHTLTVPAADVAAGTPKTYTLTNNGTHMHTLEVAAADFTRMTVNGTTTVVTQMASGHMHTVMLVCGSLQMQG